MNKKGQFMFGMVMIGVMGTMFLCLTIFSVLEEGKRKSFCEENQIPSHRCDVQVRECFNDCKGFGLEYFKVEEGSFFGSPDCWCKLNNSTKQIW